MENLDKLLDKYLLVSTTDTNGKIIYCTQGFMDISGYSEDELVDHSHNIVRHPDMPRDIFVDMWKDIKSGKMWRGELLNQNKDGTSFWGDTIIAPEYDSNGNIIGYNSVRYDISAKKEADYNAVHDYLTKLPNRAYFENVLEHALTHAKRNNTILAVLFIDVDDFKIINDTFDHQTGDKILVLFAESLKKVLRESDIVSRIGGDEFTVLLENLKCREDLLDVVNKIFNVFKEPIKIDSHIFHITISMGISVYPFDGDCIFDLMKHADHAMYYVKESGKNNFKFYEKEYSNRVK